MKTPTTTKGAKKRSVQRRFVRYTERQAELACKISNDIAEGIDCGESRKTLRMAVAYWADQACSHSQRRAAAESALTTIRHAKALMDAVLQRNPMA